jgi:hypothetical protein
VAVILVAACATSSVACRKKLAPTPAGTVVVDWKSPGGAAVASRKDVRIAIPVEGGGDLDLDVHVEASRTALEAARVTVAANPDGWTTKVEVQEQPYGRFLSVTLSKDVPWSDRGSHAAVLVEPIVIGADLVPSRAAMGPLDRCTARTDRRGNVPCTKP